MKTAIKLFFAILAGIGCVLYIYYLADLPNRSKNGFDRFFISSNLINEHQYILHFKPQQIVGTLNNEIILATNSVDRLWFLTKDRMLYDKALIIDTNLIKSIKNVFSIRNYRNKCYLIAGNIPMIIEFDFLTKKNTTIQFEKPAIHLGTYLDKGKYLFRRYDKEINDQIFTLYNSETDSFEVRKMIQPIHHDGGILTDGQLHYDSLTKKAVYIHYYDNKIVTFDENTSSLKEYKTIDTISTPNFKTSHNNRIQSPPLPINQTSCVSSGKLYVCSNLKADNESSNDYKKNIPIDIYNIQNGKYLGSFYIPMTGRNLPKDIFIQGNNLIVLFHSNVLKTYVLPW